MSQSIWSRVMEVAHKRVYAFRQFLKKNYRNYYDDRSWWDEVGSEESQR